MYAGTFSFDEGDHRQAYVRPMYAGAYLVGIEFGGVGCHYDYVAWLCKDSTEVTSIIFRLPQQAQ